MKKLFILLLFIPFLNVKAEVRDNYIENINIAVNDENVSKLNDNNYNTYLKMDAKDLIKISSNQEFNYVYIIYYIESKEGVINYNDTKIDIGKIIELGVDFDIIVTTNGDTQTKLQQGIDNIVLVSVPSTDTSASISIVFYGDAATYCNQVTTVINMKFGNKATAEYTYVDTITSEGYYRIELQLDCPTNNYRLDVSTYIGFQFDITE